MQRLFTHESVLVLQIVYIGQWLLYLATHTLLCPMVQVSLHNIVLVFAVCTTPAALSSIYPVDTTTVHNLYMFMHSSCRQLFLYTVL